MDEELQLDLFTWDRVKVGEGFSALAELDFARAILVFQNVLSKWPGHPDASAGLRMAATWADCLREAETPHERETVTSLWERIRSYPFGQSGHELRRALIQRVVVLLQIEDADLYIPPDLSLGRLFVELEDYGRAEAAFRRLLETHARDGRLLVWLGNCLFKQGKTSEARVVYAKALLSAPAEVNIEEIEDKGVVEAIAEEDIYSAAIWGWLSGVLPLVEVEVGSPHDRRHVGALLVYRTVRGAEAARAKGAHEEMVEQRRLLKGLAPAVFLRYMGRM
jgi:tetratricopeptide (TPR) repeat protein